MICAGEAFSVVVVLKVVVVVEVEMVGLKEMFEGEEGGGDGVGQVDGEV